MIDDADDSSNRTARLLLNAAVVLGIALRLFQYFSSVSVWLDEASLALDVRETSLFNLLRYPLDRLQVAPKGFLLVQGVIFRLVGDGEYALRFFPLIGSILGLFLFSRLALRALKPGSAVVATLAYALAWPLIRYAAEGKPYGIDATAAILLTLVALHIQERERSSRYLAAAALLSSCVAWFSVFATFVLVGLGISLVISAVLRRDRDAFRRAVLVCAIWAAVTLAVTIVSLESMTPSMREFMQNFWHESMLPPSAGPITALRWLGNSIAAFFTFTWNTDSPRVVVVIGALGFIPLWRRKPTVALMLAMPLLVIIGAALARQYPLFQRLMLGMLPAICIFLAASVGWVADRLTAVTGRLNLKAASRSGTVILAGFAMLLLMAFSRRLPPYRVEEIKPLLSYINAHKEPGDQIIAHFTASGALKYYAPFYGFEHFNGSTWPASADDSATIPGLDSLTGRSRVWLVFVSDPVYLDRRVKTFEYLNRVGVVLDSIIVRLPRKTEINAEAYLYDLSQRK